MLETMARSALRVCKLAILAARQNKWETTVALDGTSTTTPVQVEALPA
jgi:hypothetical protein